MFVSESLSFFIQDIKIWSEHLICYTMLMLPHLSSSPLVLLQKVNHILLIKYNLILKLQMKKLVLKSVILCASYLFPHPFINRLCCCRQKQACERTELAKSSSMAGKHQTISKGRRGHPCG
jgi:hypothetical protein